MTIYETAADLILEGKIAALEFEIESFSDRADLIGQLEFHSEKGLTVTLQDVGLMEGGIGYADAQERLYAANRRLASNVSSLRFRGRR